MFDHIANLIKQARIKTEQRVNGQEPLQLNITAETGPTNLAQPLSTSPYVNTMERARQIEASLMSSVRAEFTAVTQQLNASQGKTNESN